MKTILILNTLLLALVLETSGQIIQMGNNLRGTSFTIPDFVVRLDRNQHVELKVHTVITCRSFQVASDREHTIRLWGDATINCDLLDLGTQPLKVDLVDGVGKATLNIKYKHMNIDAGNQPQLVPADGVNLSIVKQ